MNEFAKAKIFFALALVGVLYALHPIIREHGHQGFAFFESVLQFRVIYYTLLCLLGCAIYSFAIDFLNDNPLGMPHRVGNILYAMALLFPPLFALVWLSIRVAEGVVWISDSPIAGEISKIALSIIVGSAGVLIAYLVSRRMNRRDREENFDQLAIRTKGHMQRAEEMHDAQHHDLVALEAFRAVETALQRALLDGNVHVPSSRPNQLIAIAARVGVIPENLVGVFHELRVARNRAVHAADDFNREDACWFIDTTQRMLRSLHTVEADEASEEDDDEELRELRVAPRKAG